MTWLARIKSAKALSPNEPIIEVVHYGRRAGNQLLKHHRSGQFTQGAGKRNDLQNQKDTCNPLSYTYKRVTTTLSEKQEERNRKRKNGRSVFLSNCRYLWACFSSAVPMHQIPKGKSIHHRGDGLLYFFCQTSSVTQFSRRGQQFSPSKQDTGGKLSFHGTKHHTTVISSGFLASR